MLYSLVFTQTTFNLLPSFHPEIRKQLKDALNELKEDPFLGKNLTGELTGFRSYRLKRYRIIYKVNTDTRTITVYYIGHRRTVYDLVTELISR